MKVLLDTCVVIDVLQDRQPFSEPAKEIFLLNANNIFSGYITAKSITDIYYLMHRITHDNKKSRNIIDKLLSLFQVLSTDGADCQKAILSETSDYENAVMIETALRADIDCIVTRNEHDYQHSPITIYSPTQFLEKIKNDIL